MRLRRQLGDEARVRPTRRERVLKTIGVLPSLATLGNLTCGLGAIYLCLLSAQAAGAGAAVVSPDGAGDPLPTFLSGAAYLLIAAMIFDGLDGRLARLARKTSEFGGQLDSLADIVSFGVAPAFLVICIAQPATYSGIESLSWAERAYWRAEWVMAAIYVCCAALRLARFNVENEEDESSHMGFRGLPTPGAAGAIIGLVVFQQSLLPELAGSWALRLLAVMMPPFALVLGLAMVSPFRYAHLVNAVLRGRRPFWQVGAIGGVVLIGVVVEIRLTLALATAAYALSGPLAAAYYKVLGRVPPDEPMVVQIEHEMLDSGETFDVDDAPTTGGDADEPCDPSVFRG